MRAAQLWGVGTSGSVSLPVPCALSPRPAVCPGPATPFPPPPPPLPSRLGICQPLGPSVALGISDSLIPSRPQTPHRVSSREPATSRPRVPMTETKTRPPQRRLPSRQWHACVDERGAKTYQVCSWTQVGVRAPCCPRLPPSGQPTSLQPRGNRRQEGKISGQPPRAPLRPPRPSRNCIFSPRALFHAFGRKCQPRIRRYHSWGLRTEFETRPEFRPLRQRTVRSPGRRLFRGVSGPRNVPEETVRDEAPLAVSPTPSPRESSPENYKKE